MPEEDEVVGRGSYCGQLCFEYFHELLFSSQPGYSPATNLVY